MLGLPRLARRPPGRPPGPRRPVRAALAVVIGLVAGLTIGTAPAIADSVPTPTAPTPTSTAASPEVPDPHPPLGGDGPNGRVPGGEALANRGLIVPSGAPALPTTMSANAFVLVDLDHGTVLAARDPHGRYQPASILKTLTALVLLPRLTGATAVPISDAAAGTEGSAVGLAPGGAYDADILFTAMMLMSGNDATEALTEAAGGNTAVVEAMNAKARDLGAYDTVVQTPTGLDGWTQLTSAYDMALVLRAAVAEPRLLAYDQTERAFLPAQAVLKDGKPVGTIEMDNQSQDFLTTVPGALLAKTGYTDAARHTFLAATKQGDRTLGVVMLRAERAPVDQWQQANALLAWGYALPTTTEPVGTLDDPSAATTTSTPSTPATDGTGSRPAATVPTSAVPTRNAGSTPAAGTDLAAVPVAARTSTGHGAGPWLYIGLALLVIAAFLVIELRQRQVRARRRRSRRR